MNEQTAKDVLEESDHQSAVDQSAVDQSVIDRAEWLSLSEASKYLGVHYTTLRTWSDRGDISVFRTPGGHRRFRLSDLRHFLAKRARTDLAADSHDLVDAAVGRVREQLRQLPENRRWLADSDETVRDLRRQRGRQIFSLAISYVMKPRQRERILADGHRLGKEYGAEAAVGGVGLAETGHAVQFFRRQLVSAIHEGGDAGIHDAEDIQIQRLINQFVDEVLFSVLEGYEESIKAETGDIAAGQTAI